MTAIRTVCPGCKAQVEVRDRFTLERGVHCPACKVRFALLGPSNHMGAYQPATFIEGTHQGETSSSPPAAAKPRKSRWNVLAALTNRLR